MKPRSTSFSVPDSFQKGNYDKVLRETIDRAHSRLPPGEVHWIIGALSFVGRVDEAKELFAKSEGTFEVEERIAARFFLGITITRHGLYSEGRAFFGKNLREGRRPLSSLALFFIEQGMGFYRYFSGSPRTASRRAAAAHAHAVDADFLYGRILALDLQGHASVESGEIATGLGFLERAQKLGKKLGNGSVMQSLENSLLLYRLQFGLGGVESIEKVEKKLAGLQAEDTYTESSLLLELSRQLLLRGERVRAKKALDRSSRVIFGTQNRRHEIILNLRYASLLHQEGDPAQALNYLRAARKLLHRRIDRSFELELLSLEFAVCAALDWKERIPTLKAEAVALIHTATGSVAERSLLRSLPNSHSSMDYKKGMDPLGDLLDAVTAPADDTLSEVIEQGYFGLLPGLLKIPSGFKGICLDLAPGSATFMDRGQISLKKGVTPQMRKLIELFGVRERSKEELIREIWGYEYHPLRHDTLVYQAMNQLRKLFGDCSEWIVTRDSEYGFMRDVQLIFHRTHTRGRSESVQGSKSGHALTASTSTESSGGAALNLRQMKILKIAGKSEAVDVRTLVQALKALPLTISRDLSYLEREGLLKRIGRGRATQYILAK